MPGSLKAAGGHQKDQGCVCGDVAGGPYRKGKPASSSFIEPLRGLNVLEAPTTRSWFLV